MTRRRAARMRLVTVVAVLLATGALTGSVWVKTHTVQDPTWIGLGVAGICLLLLAVGVHAVPRR